MLELITISKVGHSWYLNKAVVNPQHIAMVTESPEHINMLKEGKLELGLDNQVVFSKVSMAAISGFTELIVVGSPSSIMEKVNRNTKQLLKG
jgi:hypothetical protein